MATIPLKPLNTFIKHQYPGDISHETLIVFRDILIDFSNILAHYTVKEFNAMNERRKLQGVPTLKRLDKISIKTAGERILNQINDKNIADEVGEYNKILLCQDGAKSNG